MLRDPHLRGVDQALDPKTIAEIIDDNPMIDVFLLIVDLDCNRHHNKERADDREQEHRDRILTCLAVQEVEVWMLALHSGQIGGAWAEVRADCDPKERYSDPFLDALGSDCPGKGRKKAMRALPGNWSRLVRLCPEIKDLQEQLAEWSRNCIV
ncbi:hypothetical protein [Thiocapsa rosea]|uniref:hypothetical protein n=1 Tax=Thiocapsa rosea TaxID=69360 RepID=UPI001472EB71|nr:hypothetical protein [Thiocapsa rosea]